MVDYSSPNIAKEMHVGHLRSTVIGDSLVRILEMKGNTVIRENHVGDWGTPFGMLIERLEDLESEGVQPSDALADLGIFYRDARSSFDSDENFRERARRRVVALQSGDEATMVRWRQLVDLSFSYFDEVYDLLGVLLTKDDVRGESFYDPLLTSVVERLDERGLLSNNSGAEVMYPGDWLNREGNPLPLIIRKGDGGYNYATSDLACIIDRAERLGADDLVYVVGAEQNSTFRWFLLLQESQAFSMRSTLPNTSHLDLFWVLMEGNSRAGAEEQSDYLTSFKKQFREHPQQSRIVTLAWNPLK